MHESQILYQHFSNYMESNIGFVTGMQALKWASSVHLSALFGEFGTIVKSRILPEIPPNPAFELAPFRFPLSSALIGPNFFHKRVPSYRHLIVRLSREACLVLDFGYGWHFIEFGVSQLHWPGFIQLLNPEPSPS